MNKKYLVATLLSGLVSSHVSLAGDIEVLHWWTSGGEAKSAQVLQQMMELQGHHWHNFAVAGGGGESAMTILKTRAVSGNPPTAAQLKGHDLQEWGRLGFLTSLDRIAQEQQWDKVLPPVIANIMKYDGNYVAAPVNVHRVNWLWANPKVFKAAGATIPISLDDFFVQAKKIKQAGFVPLAHGGQPWQDVTLFENVALAVLGSTNYKRAFVTLDPKVLNGDQMVEVFRQFKRMREVIDPRFEGQSWNKATAMVIEGKAAMQIMGDWAKGEFVQANLKPGKDYICVPAPGTDQQFAYNIDSFAFFKLNGSAEDEKAQQDLAQTIMSPAFQSLFNLTKGSIPVRLDMDMSEFDQCALESMKDLKATSKTKHFVPSISQGLATTSYVQSAISDVVSEFFHDPNAKPQQAAKQLARAIRAAE
ncbi:ABC transporter substrate-binding protein [Photobacterium damselae subsp. damselae]|uniref:ABC transporter substrate-binding protein n=1 Tax=Photobacterium damselae TaxID=38293 RepID=UPI001F1FA51F|nr:ABC transporter substrate-binding protein [Photobacterium damselae]UJZ95554.1 ABC transporter substrate-binding protein [Photobacterium damselae subsp. damselae]UJZ99432.1 ABC transporter substrate-binding protein [Photobacterium damselae subsp. damselae]